MISFGWRLALLAKAGLLLAMSASFVFLGFGAATGEHAMLVRLLVLLPCAFLGFFVAWACSLGLLDALLGKSVTEAGATVLKNRRQGYSMRTPSGRFVEFILWNPWGPLRPDATYTVTYGRFSGVLVRKPEATTR